MQGTWHWLQEQAIVLTVAATALLLPLGLLLLIIGARETRRRDIGIALLTGGCFTLASLLVQLTLEKSNFTQTLSFTSDLTGFDASGRVLDDVTLAGKNLYRANLKKARLKRTDLSTANLSEARLQEADLQGADLSYSILLEANLHKANLRDANLTGAELSTGILNVSVLEGAKVHRETCWKLELDHTTRWLSERLAVAKAADQPILDRLIAAGLKPKDGKTLGHVCTEFEKNRPPLTPTAEPEPKTSRIYICNDGTLRKGPNPGDGVCDLSTT
jgi:Pentapeptide repeats (8 copies)